MSTHNTIKSQVCLLWAHCYLNSCTMLTVGPVFGFDLMHSLPLLLPSSLSHQQLYLIDRVIKILYSDPNRWDADGRSNK